MQRALLDELTARLAGLPDGCHDVLTDGVLPLLRSCSLFGTATIDRSAGSGRPRRCAASSPCLYAAAFAARVTAGDGVSLRTVAAPALLCA
jgi:hypothetical protein